MSDQLRVAETTADQHGVRQSVAGAQGTRHQSRAGYWFDLHAPVWALDKNNDVYVQKILTHLPYVAKEGFLASLAHYARSMSAAHTRNIAECFYVFIRETKPSHIDAASLIGWRSRLKRHHEWKLGTIRGFLCKWKDLGYPGIGDDVIDLLNGWTLKGNIKGDAVKRLDPRKGPLTDNELAAFNEGATRAYEQGQLTLAELALCLLISHTGRRSKQIAHTKVCDLDASKSNKKGETLYLIHIPRAKQRGEVFRDSFKTFAMTVELWTILNAQRQNSIESIERALGYTLQDADRSALPLFPDLSVFGSIASVAELRSLLYTDHPHLKATEVTPILRKAVLAAGIVSERTEQMLEVVATRFRYTKGTRAAREGLGLMVIAELLDHTDIQNVGVYTQNVPEHAQAIDKAMALQLAPYAQAFQGVLVDREQDALRGDDLSSRIKYRGQNTATCGQYGYCGANAPIPCYTCNHFQPWLDGPHEEVLADLLSEREEIIRVTDDHAMASVNDRTILAVANVIHQCQIRREELAKTKTHQGAPE